MPFGGENGLATFQKAVTKSFKEYLDNFMKIFLDDFIVIVTWKLFCKSSYHAFKSARNTTLV
jgi:hypothetical protein